MDDARRRMQTNSKMYTFAVLCEGILMISKMIWRIKSLQDLRYLKKTKHVMTLKFSSGKFSTHWLMRRFWHLITSKINYVQHYWRFKREIGVTLKYKNPDIHVFHMQTICLRAMEHFWKGVYNANNFLIFCRSI